VTVLQTRPTRLQPMLFWTGHSRNTRRRYPLRELTSLRRAWIVNVGVFLAVGLLALLVLTAGEPMGLATSRRYERFTELSFTDPAAPLEVSNGQVTLSFALHNAEGRPTAYPYQVQLDGRTVLRGRTPTVPTDHTYRVLQRIWLPPGRAPVELTVQLAADQSIHRWIDRPQPRP
jgi:hypothetical protein